jgi:predicted DNA-binding transcriptional regulator YafY
MHRTKRKNGGPRYLPSERLQILKTALASRPMSFEDIEELLGVSHSTAQRLLRVVAATEPLVEEEGDGRKKCWRMMPGARTESIRMSYAQMIALYLSRGLIAALAGTGIKEDLDDVFERLLATLRKHDADAAQNLERVLYVVPAGGRRLYEGRLDDVDEVLTAMRESERIDVLYASRSKPPRMLRFDPYTLVLFDGGLYVAGFSHEHAKLITLVLDGFREVTRKKGDRFAYPDAYHPKELFDGAFGFMSGDPVRVRIRFDAKEAHFVRRAVWHDSQRIEELEGGALVLEMNVALVPEVVTFVLSHGAGAEVLEPAELRAMVQTELAGALARYRS